jgi:hypothetical protein
MTTRLEAIISARDGVAALCDADPRRVGRLAALTGQ